MASCSFPVTGRARHDEVQVGSSSRRARNAPSSTSKPFQVSMRPTAPTSGTSGIPTPSRNRPASSGRNSAVDGLVDDLDVRGIELVGDGLRHADDLRREVPSEETLELHGATRLHDDLAGVPDVRPPGDRRGRPPVQRVQRVRVHDVDAQTADQADETPDRDRPPAA